MKPLKRAPNMKLQLRRGRPLDMGEIGRLPNGCVAVSGDGDLIARAQVQLPTSQLVALAVAMARAIPDSRFEVEDPDGHSRSVSPERFSSPQLPAPVGDAASGASAPPSPSRASGNPWSLLAAGKVSEAEAAFDGIPLDSGGRDRVRAMLRSTQPAKVAQGCRIARLTGWRSAVHNLRPHLRHADADVRLDAAQAIGALAGPAMEPALRPLLADPSPEVREATASAITALSTP